MVLHPGGGVGVCAHIFVYVFKLAFRKKIVQTESGYNSSWKQSDYMQEDTHVCTRGALNFLHYIVNLIFTSDYSLFSAYVSTLRDF